jgi:hypothetical protein
MADDKFDEDSDIGKKMERTIELNEIGYTELILTINFKASYGKIAFNIVKECKIKDYPDGNGVNAWETITSIGTCPFYHQDRQAV